MPDQPNNAAPRPSASEGRGALGGSPAAASLETTSSPDTPPTSASDRPDEDASLASAADKPDKAAIEDSREGRSLEPQSRRRLFAGAALGAISLAGLALSLLLLVAPGVLPDTGGAFSESAAPSIQSLLARGFGTDDDDGADSGRADAEGAFGGAASAEEEAEAATDGAASTTEPSANGAATNDGAAADDGAEGNGRNDSHASAESTNAEDGPSSGNSTGSGSGTGAGAGRGSGSSAGSSSSPSTSSGASGSSDASPSPAPASIAVSVVVDSSAAASLGFPATMASATLKLPEGATAYDALAATGLSLEGSSSYVSAVNGLAEKMMGGTSGWTYTVNGTMPMAAASNHILHEGDAVRWVYVS